MARVPRPSGHERAEAVRNPQKDTGVCVPTPPIHRLFITVKDAVRLGGEGTESTETEGREEKRLENRNEQKRTYCRLVKCSNSRHAYEIVECMTTNETKCLRDFGRNR